PLTRTPRRHGPRRDHLDPRGARFLDPGTAPRFDGQDLEPTAYAGAGLLVRPGDDGEVEPEVLEALRSAATAEGWTLVVDEVDRQLVEMVRAAGALHSRLHPALPDRVNPLVVRASLVRPADDHRPRS
ncbi:hypothetical protein, partial [Desulfobulbus alkaliphilus]|uniref:hypothetical protein n=1 Tax=Desulfobulbus alkaliphilus TaxID=869814 RepID=UPI0019625ED6